jgi:outer membrane receptor protein involved in Fe transport
MRTERRALRGAALAALAVPLVLAAAPPAADDEDPVLEEVVVEATRTRLSAADIPVNTSLLTRQDIEQAGLQPADEILRQVPGFSLLRSADSIAAAPTTTTVSLRGLGGSAASRTLVLLDGVPLHSPYTTEVFWARVPRHRIERIEVVRGGGANAWGNLSLGGVINIVTERPTASGYGLSATLAAPWTVDLAGSAHHVGERWTLSGDAAWYDTEGYYAVPDSQRAPVDRKVRKDHGLLAGRAEYRLGPSTRLQFNASGFREERGGGTALDVNRTRIGTLGAGLEHDAAGGGRWKLGLFYDDARLEDASVAVLGGGETERLRAFEERPTSVLGAGLTWSRELAGGHELLAGADYRWSDVRVDEWSDFADGVAGTLQTTVSSQDMGGVFVQDNWRPGERWQVNGSLRYDTVTNRGAVVRRDLPGGGVTGEESYAANAEHTVNPSLGAVFHASERFSLRGAAYRGFRAPTLRELYHSAWIRSGVRLVNNPELAPERLVGAEIGADFVLGGNARLRLTLFRNTVEDLVQNIPRGSTGAEPGVVEPCGLLGPEETCRELDNVGEMRARGLELEAELNPAPRWSLFLSYLYNDTAITRAPDNPALVGNRVRQAPEHAFTARARHQGRWFDTSLLARYVGPRYEDDLNRLEVDGFLLFDLYLSRPLGAGSEVFLQVENLLDAAYEVRVENSGAIEIGRSRFVGVGLRFRR